MSAMAYRSALIIGAGSGISASLARALSAAGIKVGLAARNVQKLAELAAETKAQTFAVDAAEPAAVARLFQDADKKLGKLDVVVYNAGTRLRGPSLSSILKTSDRPLQYPLSAPFWRCSKRRVE